MASNSAKQPSETLAWDHLAQGFANPPKEFSPVPIWWWSGDTLERERLRWQMEQLIAGGVHNVVILNLAPTSPLYGADPDQPRFMSEAWWEIFLGVCEDARQLGMRIWFYDQIGFSGANIQGEIVRAEPSYAGQSLAALTTEGTGPLQLECPSEGLPLAAACTLLTDNRLPNMLPLNGRTAATHTPGNKRLRLMYAIQRGFDYFNPDACTALLNKVHREFERRAGHFFGDVIVGSFQDELPSLPTWGVHFADAFQEIKGYDLREHLAALWEGEDQHSEQVRVDYHHVRALLAEKGFFKPFFEWHQEYGLVCGFDQQGPARSGHPIGGVQLYADYLQTHRWYGAPGSDHHGNAKIHSSLAHLYSRPRVWIEAFHSSGWGGTLEETFDWLLPWLRAGATLYNPHAVYYSTWGGWWEWAPPSTCWRQPYWRHYAIFARAVSRLCFLLSQGHHVCDIGILYPTTTVQSGLTIDGALPSAQAAHDSYTSLTGSMMFLQSVSGVLDQDRRDFDVLDDASIQRGQVGDGCLRIGEECFRAIVLPECKVLESATAGRLAEFVANGGLLLAVGRLPDHLIGASSAELAAFQNLFSSGKALFRVHPDEVKEALKGLPRGVEAPVPVLRRRIHDTDVLFVPAAFPHASYSADPGSADWLKADYRFEADRYQRGMKIRVRGPGSRVQLWDIVTGERSALPVVSDEDSREVEIPFDTAPAALLVMGDDESLSTADEFDASSPLIELSDIWACTIEQTLDNRYGDLTKPDHPGAPPLQTWQFAHRVEQAGEDGLRDRWFDTKSPHEWSPVVATFGTYGWWVGPHPAEALPAPLPGTSEPCALAGDKWQPAVYSLQRGIHKDDLHILSLGPKGHVPEEFLNFGRVSGGEGVQFRTAIWMPEATSTHLALAAPARKQAWVNGVELDHEAPGYLWITPINLNAGINLLEWRLIAEQTGDLRAYWALVTAPGAFARPERMIRGDQPRKDSTVSFVLDFDIPFVPVDSTLQVAADSPCRVLVNGVEAGRQGGFDPYASLARVQTYAISNYRERKNRLIIEVQDIGLPAPVMADGIIRGERGESLSIISGAHWQVQRDKRDAQPVRLYRSQWLDPSWSHLWRRPHPLPDAAWLDGTPSKGVVLPLVPDALPGVTRVEWFQWKLPPGAVTMRLPCSGALRVWVDGVELSLEKNVIQIPASDKVERTVALRVLPERGQTGGGVFTGPVTYVTETGRIRLGAWAEQGLSAYSGGLLYQTEFTLDALPSHLVLDLGKVRGTVEVRLNGRSVGARVWSPYRFDISATAQTGSNTLEILVLNTLAPYLQAVSPTHYVRPGQTVSGLFGPARIYGSNR